MDQAFDFDDDKGEVYQSRRPSKPYKRTNPAVWICAGAAAMLAIVAVVYWLTRSTSKLAAETTPPAIENNSQQKSKVDNIASKDKDYQGIINAIEEMASKAEFIDLRQSLEAGITGGTPEAREHAVQVGLKAMRAYQKHTSSLLWRQAKVLRDDPRQQTVEAVAKVFDSVCSETLSADVLDLIDSTVLNGSASDREVALVTVRAYRKATSKYFSELAKRIRQLIRQSVTGSTQH